MSRFDINQLSQYREHNQLEAKMAKGGFPGSFWETYSAFANTDGGVVLLGVKEETDGTLHSEDVDVEKLRKDFWNMVNNRQKISANIVTEGMVRTEELDGRKILVVSIPRAERAARPIYVGMDPKSGTFRRNHEGDYHCSVDEMALMFRDAAYMSQDASVINKMDLTVFCKETINGYRNFFRSAHRNHLWNNEDDDIFLRKIGAIGLGEDGKYHPTAAGLLMFGYEYEIIREFPNYFLDYQENRTLGKTRWTDRLVSSSGDWSGNVFDFVIEALRRMQQGVKVPFVMKGNLRVDDTPIHKLLREATTNMVVHADFFGRQGLVVHKTADGFTFSNPGTVRISISEAVNGGVSDPRNGIMLKMFSLINFGERAGSGLCGIFNVWEKVYHIPAKIEETHRSGVDRTTLSLPTGGNEQDVEAMLNLYDSGNIDFGNDSLNQAENKDKTDTKPIQTAGQSGKTDTNEVQADTKPIQNRYKDEQKRAILTALRNSTNLTMSDLSSMLKISKSSVQRRLSALVKEGKLLHVGPVNGGKWEIIER